MNLPNKIFVLFSIMLASCDTVTKHEKTSGDTAVLMKPENNQYEDRETREDTVDAKQELSPVSQVYANERFKNVQVKKTGDHQYLITGKAQIFEASFSWVIEDGHEELKQGHEMTDAGAPAWGNFSFTIDVEKKRPNTNLHLVLFEASAKDGSRQYELPLLLY
jgi:hypothetical protein